MSDRSKTTKHRTTHPAVAGNKTATPFFQPKLKVNQPGDVHEQEADKIAGQMMQEKTMFFLPFTSREYHNDPDSEQSPASRIAGAGKQAAEKVQGMQHVGSDGELVAPPAVYEALSGNGHPLDNDTRVLMETRFGLDFSGVRIHTDTRAADAAAAIQAKAYTAGQDIVFGAGEYQPGNEYGKQLLAHELVHTLQQGGGNQPAKARVIQKAPSTNNLSAPSQDVDIKSIKEKHLSQWAGIDLTKKANRAQQKKFEALNEFITQHFYNDKITAAEIEQLSHDVLIQKGYRSNVSLEIRSFICDILKNSKKYEAASFLLLDAGFQLKTSFYDPEMIKVIKYGPTKEHIKFRKEVLKEKEVQSVFFKIENRILKSIVKKDNAVTLSHDANGIVARPATGVLINFNTLQDSIEPRFSGYDILADLDDRFVEDLNQLPVTKKKEITISDVHNDLEALAKKYTKMTAIPAEAFNLLGEGILYLIGRAKEIRGGIKEASEIRSNVSRERDISRLRSSLDTATLEILNKHAVIKSLNKILLEAQIFNPVAGQAGSAQKMTSIPDLKTQLSAIITPLDNAAEEEIGKFISEEKPAETHRQLAIGFGVSLGFVQGILSLFNSKMPGRTPIEFLEIDPDNSDEFKTQTNDLTDPEFLLYLRIRSNQQLRTYATYMGWKSLQKNAEDSLFVKKSEDARVSLMSDWVIDRSVGKPFDSFVHSFSYFIVDNLGKFSKTEMRNMLDLIRQTELANRLLALKGKALKDDSIIESTTKQVDEELAPEKWSVGHYAYHFKSDELSKNKHVITHAIIRHPQTRAVMKGIKAKNPKRHFQSYRDEQYENESVRPTFWTFPNPLYYGFIQTDNVGITGDFWSQLTEKERKAIQDELNAGKGLYKETGRMHNARRKWFPGYQAGIKKSMRPVFIEATDRDRINLKDRLIQKQLKPLENTRKFYYIAKINFEEIDFRIWRFGKYIVLPAEKDEIERQQAKLVLDLGTDLAKHLLKVSSLKHLIATHNTYIIGRFLPWVNMALSKYGSLSEDEKIIYVDANRDLKKARDAMTKAREKIQKAMGFKGSVGAKPHLSFLNGGFPLKTGDEGFYSRQQYIVLVDVLKNFQFYPPFGYHWSQTSTAYSEPLVIVDGKDVSLDGNRYDLFKILIDGEEKTVYYQAGDWDSIDLLVRIYTGLDWRAFGIQMEQTGRLIETGFEYFMEGLSWIPGLGQFIDIARFSAAFLDVLFKSKDILEILQSDPQEILDGLKEDLTGFLESEDWLVFLLMGGPEINLERQKVPDQKTESKRKKLRGGGFSGILDLIKGIAQFGRRIVQRLLKIRNRVVLRFRGLRTFVFQHPAVLKWLEVIIGYLRGKQTAKATSPDVLPQFTQRLTDTLGAVSPLALPPDIINFNELVRLLVNALIEKTLRSRKVGIKGKVAGKAIYQVIELLDGDKYLADKVGNWLASNGITPNLIWQKFAQDNIQPLLTTVQKDILDQLRAELNLPQAQGLGDVEINFSETEEGDETNPSLRDDRDKNDEFRGIQNPVGGEPLKKTVRQEAEGRLGHDLSHVRVHRDADAATLNNQAGSEALTTGSHIYFASGQESGPLLYHEITHVLQQTGPRPLDQPQADQPQKGQPQRGFVLDDDAEAQAEKVAHTFDRSTIKFESKQPAGIQPKLSLGRRTIANLMEEILSVEELASETEAYESAKRPGMLKGLDKTVEGTAQEVFSHIWQKMTFDNESASRKFDFPYLEPLWTKMKTNLTGFKKDFDAVVPVLARKTQIGGSKGAKFNLDVLSFVHLLEDYLLAKTGIGVKVDWSGGWKSQTGKPPASLTVTFYKLFLPFVGRQTSIWKEGVVPALKRDKKYTELKKTKSEKEIEELVVLYIESEGFSYDPFVKNNAQLTFKQEILQDLDKFHQQVHKGTQADPILVYWYVGEREYPPSIDLPGLGKGGTQVKKNEQPPKMITLQKKSGPEKVQVGVKAKNWDFIYRNKQPIQLETPDNDSDEDKAKRRNFNEALASVGYDMKGKNMDADHIRDKGFGGENSYDNLWPLDRDINQRPFKKWGNQKVTFKDANDNLISKPLKARYLNGKYIKIIGYSDEGPNPLIHKGTLF